MATIVPKLTDDRTLAQIHSKLMYDIEMCADMIGFSSDEDRYKAELEEMCQQLGNLEEVMALKWDVDCDCFYTGKDLYTEGEF